jgi:hypothetical protein
MYNYTIRILKVMIECKKISYGSETETKSYDVWWQKGQESDDDMARDHQEAWERTIEMLVLNLYRHLL